MNESSHTEKAPVKIQSDKSLKEIRDCACVRERCPDCNAKPSDAEASVVIMDSIGGD